MKKNKIILLILVTLLFSGCSVKYDLFINDDLSVNERVTATENSNTLKMMTSEDPKVAANSLFELYAIEGNTYNITTTESSDSISSLVTTSFTSLEEYGLFFQSDIVNDVNITQKGSYITLEYKQDVPLDDYSSKSLIYDSIEVNINVPFKVTENNADSVKGNTYTWNITKDGKLKDIKITFNKDETDISKKINILGFFEINVKYSVLLISGLAILILVLALIAYIRNKKNNRF